MYKAFIAITGHPSDHRYLAGVFAKERILWPRPEGGWDYAFWGIRWSSNNAAELKKQSRRVLAIAMNALKTRNRPGQGKIIIEEESKPETVYEETATTEKSAVKLDKIPNPIDTSIYKHGTRIYAPGAPTYVPRGTVISRKGQLIIVQLDRKKGLHGGHLTPSGGIDIALGPHESWSYEPFTKNPDDTDLEELVDKWQAKEDWHYTKTLELMREYGITRIEEVKTRKALAEQIMTEMRAMANAARYSGQAFGLSSGEEPPQP